MTPRFTLLLTLMFATNATLYANSADAAAGSKPPANEPDVPDANTEPDAPPGGESSGADEAPKPVSKDSSAVAPVDAGSSPVELADQTYLGVGLRYRAIIVPKFMMNLFGDGGRTVLANGIGPEFTVRKNAFEYEFAALFSSYAMDPTPFKAKSDGPDAWELVESKIKVLYLTADFVWSHDFAPEFALNYGVGAGFGFVWGDLIRDQATRGSANANDSTGDGYVACAGPTGQGNCVKGKHYDYLEPSWANGGSKPVIFPWLALQTGFRYKPHRNFIARFDAGFGTSGFFLGLGADYGL